jgi:hypothetical protein
MAMCAGGGANPGGADWNPGGVDAISGVSSVISVGGCAIPGG